MYISLPSFMLISLDFLFSLIFAFYKRDVCTYNSTNMYKYTRQQQTASFYFSYVVVACYYSRVIIHIEFFFFHSFLQIYAPYFIFRFTCSCSTACSLLLLHVCVRHTNMCIVYMN